MSERVGRGWLAVGALALITTTLSVVQPALLIFVPFALLAVALPPRRPVIIAVAAMIGMLVFRSEPANNALWYFERGWALVLGAWFVLAVALAPEWKFLPRALAAVAATVVTAAALLALSGGFAGIDMAVESQFRGGASQAIAAWTQAVGFDRVSEEMQQTVMAAAELQIKLYPALLALGSIAALGVAWWAFMRLGRGAPNPLLPLREFRFRDELVWLLIAGLILLLLPIDDLATRAGENLLTFMAVLYALRGAAVLMVIGGAPGPIGLVVGALLVVFMFPFAMAATFVVGLSDTWLDIRARRALGSDQ